MAIKGKNLRVFIGGKCIAAATSCTLHVSAQVEDSSTKDSEGNWSESECTGKSWDISCDALVVLTDPVSGGDAKLADDILDAVGTTVTVTFDQTSGAASTHNRTAVSPASAIKKTGSAILTDVSITAANRQNGTITAQFTGTGALS